MFKALIKFAAVGATMLPLMAQAQTKEPTGPFGGNFTGLVTLTSDYRFRGISQSGQDPALQGGLNYDFVDTSFGDVTFTPYIGFWGSSINFGNGVELDILPGVKGKLLNGTLAYDLGLTLYRYAGAGGGNFTEARGSLGYDFGFAAVTGLYAYSWDYFNHSGDSHYVNGAISIPLGTYGAATPKIFGSIGYQWIDDNPAFGTPDYMDYQLGLGVNAWTIDFSLAYVGTDLDRNQCFGSNACDERFVLTVTKTF